MAAFICKPEDGLSCPSLDWEPSIRGRWSLLVLNILLTVTKARPMTTGRLIPWAMRMLLSAFHQIKFQWEIIRPSPYNPVSLVVVFMRCHMLQFCRIPSMWSGFLTLLLKTIINSKAINRAALVLGCLLGSFTVLVLYLFVLGRCFCFV